MAIIQVRGLRKSYGDHEVLRGIDLDVQEGRILGVLGPNGSGKTTLVECIAGLRARDGGRVSVGGTDPRVAPPSWRSALGIQLQHSALPPRLRTDEAVELFASFYPDPVPSGELLESFGLGASARSRVGSLSGGQAQRLSVALALVGQPAVAILDELTTGLDPDARRRIWAHLQRLRSSGVALILVTHSMEEAERLCDRVVLLSGGRIIADGSPQEIVDQVRALPGSRGDQTTLEDAYLTLTSDDLLEDAS